MISELRFQYLFKDQSDGGFQKFFEFDQVIFAQKVYLLIKQETFAAIFEKTRETIILVLLLNLLIPPPHILIEYFGEIVRIHFIFEPLQHHLLSLHHLVHFYTAIRCHSLYIQHLLLVHLGANDNKNER